MDNDYLIKKPPLQALFLFALPMIIGNLFQQTYTMVDLSLIHIPSPRDKRQSRMPSSA